MIGKLLCCVAPFVLPACEIFDPAVCTTEAAPAVSVTVLDSATNGPLPPIALTVSAATSSFADTVSHDQALPGLVTGLAHERAGTYRVGVVAPGYRPWSVSGVKVTRGECGVRTAPIVAKLQRSFVTPALQRDAGAPIQTDSLLYHLRQSSIAVWTTNIGFTYRNTTQDTLRMVNCNAIYWFALERLEGNAWITRWIMPYPACASPDIVYPPGAIITDTFQLLGAEPRRNLLPAFGSEDIDGVYRMRWNNLHHLTAPELPLEFRTSNSFVLIRSAN